MRKGEVDEDELIRILQEEEEDAVTFYSSELAREQAAALDRYFARPYNDGSEVPNRSQVVTHDIQDAVNWLMPHLLRHFTQTDDLLTVQDDGMADDDNLLQDAADFLRHVFFKDNSGETIIHDYLFDGFVQRYGVLRTLWEQPQPEPPEVLEGQTVEQVTKLASDRRYAILSAQIDGEIEQEPAAVPTPAPMPAQGPPDFESGLMGPMQSPPGQGLMASEPLPTMLQPQPLGPEPTFSLQVQKRPRGRLVIEAMPPEEFRLSRRARSIDDAPYHGGRFEVYLAEVVRDHPDRAQELDPEFGTGEAQEAASEEQFGDERIEARFGTELDTGISAAETAAGRQKVVVMIEYVRGDFDRDGVVELRRVKRCGRVVLENDVVKESEFSMWSPIRIAHRAIGMSLADTLLDIQRIRTVLTRKAMDGLSQSLMPRTAVSRNAIQSDPGLLDRLLDHEVGDVIPVDGEPGRVFMPLTTPDVSSSAFQAIEYWDRRSEEASGVNRHAMGIQPQAITDTKGGIDALQAAANSRVEQYARWASHGLETALSKALRLLIKHQDQERIVKINGRRLKADPRRWSDEMTVTVHVGMAAESRERKLAYLGAIAAKQEMVLMQLGPSNPLVSLKHWRHTFSRMIHAMGEKSAAPFVAEVPADWKPPEPGTDPKVAEAEAKAKQRQVEFQQETQIQQQRLAGEQAASEREFAHKQSMDQATMQADAAAAARKAAFDRELEQMRIESDARLAEMKVVHQAELDRERMAAEMALSRWRSAQEIKVALHRNRQGARQSSADADGKTDVRFGGQIG